MVKITNGVDEYEVSKGAFETIFKAQGYRIIDAEDTVSQNASDDLEDGNNANEDEAFVDEIIKKPVSEWTQEELKRFADVNEISLEGMKPAQARETIAEFIG